MKQHLMKRVYFACWQALWAGLKTAHKISPAQCLVLLPGAPLWLGASLTITSIVLATKPACPYLLSPMTLSKQTDNDQVNQMSTSRLSLCRPPPSTSLEKAEA